MSPSEDENQFVHLRHKSTSELPSNCDLVLACPQFRSNVNLSRIARAAGCSGVNRIIVVGNSKIDPKIARDASETIEFERRGSLVPVLKKYKSQGYELVGLEQTTNSTLIFGHQFQPRTVLVIGHERLGITPEVLGILNSTVEIPVFGLPFSFNVATATAMALYEYCRQFSLCER